MYIVTTFYKFFPFTDYISCKTPLLQLFRSQGIKGTVLLADEGINGTISGTRAAVDAFYAWCEKGAVGTLEVKESETAEPPFKRGRVKLKKELISLGRPAHPRAGVGTYLDSKAWNDLIANPNTIVLDTRNDYELELGTFKGAINPRIHNFRELPDYIETHLTDKTAPIATFCTGGIRCEKLTAYMKEQGYQNIYHLKGGILQYLKDTPKDESLWEGKCFVFDERIGVE